MTTKKAMEILVYLIRLRFPTAQSDERNAIILAIHSLERLQHARDNSQTVPATLLPGETID